MNFTGRVWGATAAEQEAHYPCDGLLTVPHEGWIRAVDVAAPCATAFRWVHQLAVAPYSYDWIDFRGRRSPDRLTPGLAPLEVGQRFLVFDLVDFATDKHVTGVLPAQPARRHGQMAVSYVVVPHGDGCRLLVKVDSETRRSPVRRLQRRLLAWGDLVMMRKQLLTLKKFAERDAAAERH
ncbi:hypothetical protein Stsp01_15490 [Streptomyces sp. NBRC 13847]|uniref:hypothetical protein n=1 Tax=Streptomyces TaxID=1883 RepID=UPI0024A55252|nr:hypothetical protein [Streptomyces sp. NBRC 13847]GLW14806.1 hypothetical protein Stsp01_15490 [Streptomyces sp. NBRC 13847]